MKKSFSAGRLKQRLKKFTGPYILPRSITLWRARSHRVLVASMPRCGSTLLFRAIAGHPPGSRSPKNDRQCQFINSIIEMPDKRFLKTHATAPQALPSDLKVIFLFGDPLHAIWSTWKKRFKWQHFGTCGYTHDTPPDIFHRDDLGYEKIFDSWMDNKSSQILKVRYEALWDNRHLIEEFIGRPVLLPPKRQRQTQVPPDCAATLQRTYAQLIHKTNQAPDLSIG